MTLDALTVSAENHEALQLLSKVRTRAFLPQNEQGWSPEAFLELIRSPGVMCQIFYACEVPVGFCLIRKVCDEAELITIAVDPEHRGEGYGQAILTNTLENLKAEQIARLFLEVRADNAAAVALYLKEGFVQVGRRKDYYKLTSGARVDAVVYSLDL